MDEISEASPKEQKLAAPTAFLYLSHQEKFIYQKYELLPSKYLVINCIYKDDLASFLPVLHDFQIKSSVYAEYFNNFKDRQKYLALTSSDGSVILYLLSEPNL